ncbi:MAG TPA: ferric reductase-like transmembrane domain-containing protein, partial [Acidimicrobiia bacterium]|nr:ferric reductase-like transmembrane domain-containing protein [Acidimicrobiia bacterium]
MATRITWYLTRGSGLVAWALLLGSMVWGLLLATRALGRKPSPAWTLSLHRFLGGLALAFVGVHVGAILVDNYTSFSLVNVLVPFTGTWHPAAVAFGIIAMYLLLAVEITSLVRDRLSARTWRAVHLLSYFLFGTATIHMITAGTDLKAIVASSATVLLCAMVAFGSAALYLWRTEPRERGSRLAARDRTPTRTARQPSMHAPMNTSATTTNDALNSRPSTAMR